jgi:eight-cysteine-cluster-containing protein
MKKEGRLLLILLVAVIIFFGAVWLIQKPAKNSNLNAVNSNTATVAECERDSDCLVVVCSNQLCLPRDTAPQTYSTCQWSDEYTCYAQDNCLCQNKKCQWQGSEQFQTCVNNLRK